jgi:hypothetical protein
MLIVTSEHRLFAWGYYSPFANLNNTPRPISYLESKKVSSIWLEAEEVIVHPDVFFTDFVVDGYYSDINQYHLFSFETMPSTNVIVYLKLKPKVG